MYVCMFVLWEYFYVLCAFCCRVSVETPRLRTLIKRSMRGSNLLAILAIHIFAVKGQSQTPGCPPPIATFIDYDERVLVPKSVDQKVVTVKVRENNYFGETKCSIPQELQE